MRFLALSALLSLTGCSLVLDFDTPLGDAAPAPDAEAPDADPLAPDAGPDPRTLYEPNDSITSATPIFPDMMYGPIAVYPMGDHDFYMFTLDAAHDVTIDLLFLNVNGDLDMRLYDTTGAMIPPPGGSSMDNEQIVHTTATNGQIGPGDYFIEVYGFNNTFTNDSYALRVTVM